MVKSEDFFRATCDKKMWRADIVNIKKYIRMPRILQSEHVNNNEVLGKIGTRKQERPEKFEISGTDND